RLHADDYKKVQTDTYLFDTSAGTCDAALMLRANSDYQVGVLNISVASNGKLLGKAKYSYVIRDIPGRIIDQGTDDFVNICIDQDYELLSGGGTLFCQTDDTIVVALRR